MSWLTDILEWLGLEPSVKAVAPRPSVPVASPPVPPANFAAAVAVVLAHEGGLVNDPTDPGGLTNMGITLRSYPQLGAEGIRNLSRADASSIYYRDWWTKYGWDKLPGPVGAKVFDLGVNMGAVPANECLQDALVDCGAHGLAVDGVVGPATVSAAAAANQTQIMEGVRRHAIAHYQALVDAHPSLQRFLAGWINRVNS